MSWIDDPWMGFDTETTGVRALKDRLVTAALVLRIDGASYRSGVSAPDQVATWLTDPGVEIPEQATAVHGITTEDWAEDFEKYLRKQGKDANIDREWPQITPRGRGGDQE